MKKYAFVVAICLIASMATLAFAAAVRVNLATIDTVNYPDGEGRAILNYAKGADKTEIQVNCSGLTPGETYTVWVDDGAGFVQIEDEFVAGPNGKGHFHGRCAGDVSDCIKVAVNEGAAPTILFGTP